MNQNLEEGLKPAKNKIETVKASDQENYDLTGGSNSSTGSKTACDMVTSDNYLKHPLYLQFILQKSIPLMLFNDYIYDATIGDVRPLRQDEDLINPETGELDKTYKERDKVYLVKEAHLMIRQLCHTNQNILVYYVTGQQRTGKSLLSNLIINDNPNQETKGIWMEARLIDNEKGQKFILLETEGFLGHALESERDDIIFLLSVLLSSLLTYNTVGNPCNLESLSFISNMGKKVVISDSSEKLESTIHNIGDYTPDFIWVFRDNLLQIPSEYNTMEELMEKKVLVGENRMFDIYNIKRDITKLAFILFFQNRKYDRSPPPSTITKHFRNLIQNWNIIDSNFVREIQRIALRIKNETNVKKFKNQKGGSAVLTLELFPAIVSNFVMNINTPSFTDPISIVSETSIRKCKQEALKNYNLIMECSVNENMPIELTQLMEVHNRTCNTLCEENLKLYKNVL